MLISDTKILILSMPKSRKRRAFMDLKLANAGIKNYEYLDAIDGCSIKEKYYEYESRCSIDRIRTIQDGIPAYGCLMSYCSFFQNSPKGQYMVFEDDVYFHRRFFEIVRSIPDDVMQRYDMLFVGYNNYEFSGDQMMAIQNGDIVMPLDRHVMTYGTYGILYGAKAMEYFKRIMTMDMPHREVYPADNIIWRHAAYNLRSAIVNPPLVIPEVRISNIRESRDLKEWCQSRFVDIEEYMDVDKYNGAYSGLD